MPMIQSNAVAPAPRAQLSPAWSSRAQLALKFGLDMIASALALIVLSPLFLVLAVCVKLSSRGPIFYRWRVVGQGGRPFTGFKFRSMYLNADALRDELEHRNEMTGPVFKIADDPRITPVGRWMRKYSLDELPQ